MPAHRDVLTMFHRRLVLLLAVFAAALLAITVQLGRVTLVHGAEHRADAESRLEAIQWVQTTRGRVLDRKARVLAQDRPSFDVAVDYRVISGAWAQQQAGAAARRFYPEQWADATKAQRDALIDRYVPAFAAHVERGWKQIAKEGGLTEAEMLERVAGVRQRVEKTEDAVQAARRANEYNAVLARGAELTTEVQKRISRRVATPIAETQSPHVVLAGVSDAVGFSLLKIASETETLSVPGGGGEVSGPVEAEVPVVPGLSVRNSADREYPYETVEVELDQSTLPSPLRGAEGEAAKFRVGVSGVATNVLGWVGKNARKEDIDARRARLDADPALREASLIAVSERSVDRGGYEDGDAVGRWGVEAGREDWLRGLRGLRVVRRDTGGATSVDAVPGRDVQLTIDVKLQALVQAAMDPALGLACVQEWHRIGGSEESTTMPVGTPLNGAAVVLEIATGEVLAMVSTPSFTRDQVRESPESVFDDPLNTPYIDRCISRPYEPGSIVKAPLLCAAVTLGKHALHDHIACTGQFDPRVKESLRCWIFKTFNLTHSDPERFGGPLSARQALMVSCNIYFYTVGRKLGGDGIRAAYAMFDVGRAFRLGVTPGREEPGGIGRLGQVVDGRRELRIPTSQEAVMLGIGQGPVVWTPMHAANALATIARRGVDIHPRVIDDGRAPDAVDLHLDQPAVDAALAGLHDSVNDTEGTGNHLTIAGQREPVFNVPGVEVWGKTGTADASPLSEDVLDANGKAIIGADGKKVRRVLRDGDHSWFVVLVGPSGGEPRYAIAVLMEYAGSGGKVSGPIANQVIHALRAEGYL